MSAELAEQLDEDDLKSPLAAENRNGLSETPRTQDNVHDIMEHLGLTDKERDGISKGKSVYDIRTERREAERDAGKLIDLALDQEKISAEEAKKFRKQLEEAGNQGTKDKLIEDIQQRVANVETKKDKKAELDESDPDLQKAYKQYDKLIDENQHLLGKKAAEEYKEWIREQKPSIETVEQLTVKFLQSERPPRVEAFNALKTTLRKYGIGSPLEIPYLAEEGLSEKRAFLRNIQQLEAQFQNMGGVKRSLYSQKAERELMRSICTAESPEEQSSILKEAQILSKEEATGFTTLKAAVSSHKISQKSMNGMLEYYRNLDTVDARSENLKLWDTFIENEAKLTDKLKEVFDAEPKNEEGFKLAFRIFKDLDYSGKEKFIEEQERKREKETKEEDHNKELAIETFKHECSKACEAKTISEKTESNYSDWIDKNSEGKSFKEVKEFLDILTSPEPNEKYKNLKAYKNRREKFTADLRRLRDVNPAMTDEELKEWQDEYDEEGWNKRAEIHKELKLEIDKALKSRTKERFGKLGVVAAKEVRDAKEADEETAAKNKETAINAIRDLLKLKAYGTAMKLCAKLLKDNPFDEDVLSLLDEIAKYADAQTIVADQTNEKEIFDKYGMIADKMMVEDKEVKFDTDEIQTQEQALIMARKDQEQRHQLNTKDRNKEAVLDKVKGDKEIEDIARDYLEGSEDEELLNVDTLTGQEAVVLDFDTDSSRDDKLIEREEVQAEREKAGDKKGSTIIEFEQGKTGRTIDARSGKEAELQQNKEKEEMAEEMAEEIVEEVHAGEEETPEQLALAKEAALAKLEKKANTKISRMDP